MYIRPILTYAINPLEICGSVGYSYGMEKYGVVSGEESETKPKAPADLHELWQREAEIALKRHLKNSTQKKGVGPSIEPSGRQPA